KIVCIHSILLLRSFNWPAEIITAPNNVIITVQIRGPKSKLWVADGKDRSIIFCGSPIIWKSNYTLAQNIGLVLCYQSFFFECA
ncbi:MAG: hypothetical protein DBP01_15550, partial [gamma proteobacterium symbiont of Ctena orbiculata]